jgi:hypothetical protein
MNSQTPQQSLEMKQSLDKASEPPTDIARYTGIRRMAVSSPEDRHSFRVRLECLLHALDVPDVRHDISMKEFLKWRMQVLWFLCLYLGSGHPYTAEFLLTVEREADPHSNGRFVIAGQAILEALRSDFDDGFLTDED